MPEITREEAVAQIKEALYYSPTLSKAAMDFALAAMEDAERVDALAYDLEGGPIFDQYGERDVHMIAATDAHIETDERGAYCRAFRAAIDRARGVTVNEGGDRERV